MTSTYATEAELTARLSSAYATPADAAGLLVKASELIDYSTLGRAEAVFTGSDADAKALLSDATCDQVEYWLEVGEEKDVVGLRGSLLSGRLQIGKLPPTLGPRAARTLRRAGLLWAGVGAV